MREAIFILLVLLALFGLTAYRYRRQIGTMINLWRMMKSMRGSMNSRNANELPKSKSSGLLVRCAKCGTWSPESRSIKLRSNIFYCSSACVEKAVEVK